MRLKNKIKLLININIILLLTMSCTPTASINQNQSTDINEKSSKLRNIYFQDELLIETSYKLASIDEGHKVKRGGEKEIAMRIELQKLYSKVPETLPDIADITVVGVTQLTEKGIYSNNLLFLQAINLSLLDVEPMSIKCVDVAIALVVMINSN